MANGLLAKNGLIVTGSIEVQNAVTASAFSGDGSGLVGVAPFPYTGSAIITGSLEVIGPIAAVNKPGGTTIDITNITTANHGTEGVYIGYNAAPNNTLSRNTVIGKDAGANSTSMYDTVVIGTNAGESVSSGMRSSVTIGTFAGMSTNGLGSSVTIGAYAGRYTGGNYNVFLGHSVGYWYGGGSSILIGRNAGYSGNGQTDGDRNMYIGVSAGAQAQGGDNIILGYQAGYNASGSKNVILGYQAGYNLTGSNQLIIANTGSHALVTGDFENNTLDISGSSTIIGSGNNPLNTIFSVKNPFSSQTNLFNIGEKGDIAFQGGPFSNRFISSIYPEMRLWGSQGTIGFDGGSFLLRAGKRFAIQHHPGYTEGIRFGTFGGSYYAGFYNQKLGIGTSSPSEKLTVNGNISASGNFITDSHITASGSVSASTYYGDGSNLTGIETDPFPYTGSAIITGSLEVMGTQRSLYTTQSFQYDGSNLTQITMSFENGTEEITNITYDGSNVDAIVITGSDGINKTYTLSYNGSGNVTNIIVS